MVLDLLPLQLHIPTCHGFIRPLVNDEETATGVETVNHGGQKAISHERSTYTDLCFAIRKTDATC